MDKRNEYEAGYERRKEEREKIKELSQKRENGEITVEEAREKSPVGWWECNECGWDGVWSVVSIENVIGIGKEPKSRYPECGNIIENDD